MQAALKIIIVGALWLWAGASLAQPGQLLGSQNQVRLSSSAAVDVAQDFMTLNLSTTRAGADASAVQALLKVALDSGLQEAKKVAVKGQLDVKTGPFSLSPRHGRDGKLSGWEGTVELIMEGRDFERISSTAGKIQTLTVAGLSFSLSRELRAKVKSEVQAMAIANFKTQAEEIAKGFGFSGYALREVDISANDINQPYRPRMMALEARAANADAPIPVEAGKSSVQVTVSGSIQLK